MDFYNRKFSNYTETVYKPKTETLINPVIHVLRMLLETKVKKQGNSSVIILPKNLGFKPNDKVKVMIINKKVSRVKDIAGLFKKKLAKTDTDKLLREVKKELWGDF